MNPTEREIAESLMDCPPEYDAYCETVPAEHDQPKPTREHGPAIVRAAFARYDEKGEEHGTWRSRPPEFYRADIGGYDPSTGVVELWRGDDEISEKGDVLVARYRATVVDGVVALRNLGCDSDCWL